ncbi:glucan 1,4-alpha-maltotetraohydrolase domain-containing protein [Elusimicrobiota bacterium]
MRRASWRHLSAALILLAPPCLAGETGGAIAFPQLLERSGNKEISTPHPGPGAPLKPRKAVRDMGASSAGGAVMLQGFHWESHETSPWWGVISAMAGEIADAGFDYVWFPPSGAALSDEGYLPNRWYVQDSAYGTQDELRGAIAALRSGGVGAIGDVVINHRVGTKDWADFTDPAWGPDAVTGDDEWPGATGNADTGTGYHAARDIDHTNPRVQQDIMRWMNWLKNMIGYSGWRFDYVRGFHPGYLASYNEAASPSFSVAEIWDYLDVGNPDSHRQALCDWLDQGGNSVSAFDFTTKGMLQYAVGSGEYWRLRDGSGKPAGLIGWWPARAVTFIDNHDTGPSPGGSGGQNHWPFPGEELMQGYAYILTHPGVPCVYWPHYFDWGLKDEIKALIRIRKSMGITATSEVAVKSADHGKYAAVIDERVAVKIGGGDWSPSGDDWALAAYGKNYAVWAK